ncbi:MAG: transporter [Gemmatimonadetes bacterium]|nr:transporter [Gemmatimonadota bacterium]
MMPPDLIRRSLPAAPRRALRVARRACLLGAVAAAAVHAQAAERRPAPIETDRPDFIESSVVVPAGSWQLENGLLFARTGPLDLTRGTESLLRVSINARLEWRVGLPNLEWERGPGALGAGHGDAYAGLKWQLGPVGPWEMAIIPGTSIPVGGAGRSSGTWDPELKFTAARDLAAGFDFAGMLALAAPTEDGVRVTTFQPALSIGREVTPVVRLFVEWVGAYEAGRETGHLAHAGVGWQVTPDVLLDAHVGHRLSGDFPDNFVALGFSFRRGASR